MTLHSVKRPDNIRNIRSMYATAPRIISLSPLSLATNVTDVTIGASGLWLGTRTGAGGTTTLTESFFWPQPMAPWRTGPSLILACKSLVTMEVARNIY